MSVSNLINHSLLRILSIVLLATFDSPILNASDYEVTLSDKAPPAGLGESIQDELAHKAILVLHKGKPMYEVWLRKSLLLKTTVSSPNRALNAIAQTTLLGAIRITNDERDYRDDELYEGLYTIRFGLRPEDGNHLGTSEHLFFAVLIDSKYDQELGKIVKSKQLVKASSKTSANDHPMILSLFPVASSSPTVPTVHEPAHQHQAVRLSLPAKNPDGSDAGSVVFDLVIEGMADF